MNTDLTGRTAGTFRIQDKLGEGGMGAVYRGVDTMVERTVAVKVLKPEISGNPEIVERFRTEAVTLARLNHPSIATLYTFFREGADYFMVMEFVSGSTLEDAIRKAGALPWRQATDIMIHILEALQHAHQFGVLHRDIKPANIMLPTTGGVKVTDFGIAQVLGAARLTREGRMVGTLEYLAPERILGKPFDERSDLYSAGVVFYEMLSGHLPFEADTDYALIRAQTEAPPPPIENFGITVPRALIEVLWKSLAKLPEQRYPNAVSMTAALRDAKARAELESPPVDTRETRLSVPGYIPSPAIPDIAPTREIAPPVVTPAVQPSNASSRAMWAVGALVLVLSLAAAGYVVLRNFGPHPDTPTKPVITVVPDDPGGGAPPVARRNEPIVAVGPAVVIGGDEPTPGPGPGPNTKRGPNPTGPPGPGPGPGRGPGGPSGATPPPVVVTPPPVVVTPPPITKGIPAATAGIGIKGFYVAGQTAASLQFPASGGVMIVEILKGSAAGAAGLRGASAIAMVGGNTIGVGGDLITAINGQPIQNQESIARILVGKRPGELAEVTILRAGRLLPVPMQLSGLADGVAPLQGVLAPAPTPAVVNPPVAPPPTGNGVGLKIEVIHDHSGVVNTREWPACRGYLQAIGGQLVYVVQSTSDGRNDSFRIQLTQIQEAKTNVLPIRTLQAFHLKIDGKNFNFIPTQMNTLQAISEIQRAMSRR